jgi:thioredoxin reductase
MPEQFDLVILGAGSTAFAAALRAAESGKTVALGLLYSRFLQFSEVALSYKFAIEITNPPATMSIPPIANVSEGVCLKTSHEISWAIEKKKTT